MNMSEPNIIHNTDAGVGTLCEGPRSGRGRNEASQVVIQRNPRQALRTNWTKELNKIVMWCYFKSDPTKRGFRKRMHTIWKEKGLFDLSEQKLAGQARAIKANSWLSEVELDDIKRKAENENTHDSREEVEPQENPDVVIRTDNNVQVIDDVETPPYFTDLNEKRMKEDGMSEDDIRIWKMMRDELLNPDDQEPINLRFYDRKRLKKVTTQVNQVVPYINTNSLFECNQVLKAASRVVTKLLGIKKREPKKKAEPWWKKRIRSKIVETRKDLSKLKNIFENKKDNAKDRLYQKYNIKQKGLSAVIEELKQRVTARKEKLKRYESRNEQFQQNRLFQNNQKRLFEQLEGIERGNEDIPEAEATNNFWRDIWEKETFHNEKAEWISRVEEEVGEKAPQQEDITITVKMLQTQASKLTNWKSPGPDGVQGYWIKNIKSLHPRLAAMFNDCLAVGNVPSWLTKGRTVLIMKDKTKGNAVTNYRPITCLALMWKLFTSMISEEIYKHLDDNDLLPEEQKGCRKKSRGTKDQLLIDRAVIKNCKRRQVGLAMGWIDYKKAFDMVPHSWIIKCLEMLKISGNIKDLLKNSMNEWESELTAGGQSLGRVKIRRGIFQGDSLSPLLFVISLIPLSFILRKMKARYDFSKSGPSINHLLYMDDLKLFAKSEKQLDTLLNTVRIFSSDIKMEFGISKCGVLVMKKGKHVFSEGIELPSGETIQEIDNDQGYKYLGILEADSIKDRAMKTLITKEYIRRLKKILKSKLNGRNTISAINSRAVSVIRYSAGIVSWNINELKQLDRKTRKILTMYNSFHKKGDVDRLYLDRAEGGRGLISVEDCVLIEKSSLLNYVSGSEEELLSQVVSENVLSAGRDKKECKDLRRENLKSKKLHSVFFEKTEFKDLQSWEWLRNGDLKKATEGTIMAAQEQATRTRWIRHHIDKEDISPLCRLCGEREENVAHLVSECTQLAQKQYKHWRHDKVAQVLHWQLCKDFGLEHGEKWYDHKPKTVLENENVKILWDMKIQTDKVLAHNRPDIVVFEKGKRSCRLIDVACPFDTRVVEKEREKLENYNDLKFEIRRIWNCSEVQVIPIVIGALGTVAKSFKKWLDRVNPNLFFGTLQKACLLGTARILRYVLDI